jgi:rifampicin phosphotransferase
MTTRSYDSFVPLTRLTPDAAARSGAKAWNCARLLQAGFPVPDGLVALATATDSELAALAAHPWFDGQPVGATFAVRSSGIGEDGDGQSFAGIHETHLHVARAGVPAAASACRHSGRSATALEYRRARGLPVDRVEMGVFIQRMVQPVASGVAFSINPLTGAAGEMVINAAWGVGEALVSGHVDPDEFVVRKQDQVVAWSRIGEKGDGAGGAERASLTPTQVRELAALVARIERHFGAPQDIEWCHDGAAFWIVQSRPVTAAPVSTGETEWTRANLAEVLPNLTSPQALAGFEDLLNRGERRFAGGLLAPDTELGPTVKAFGGRLYFNLTQLRRICRLSGMPAADMLRSMGHAGAIHPDDERRPGLSIESLRAMPALARVLWRHVRAARIVRDHKARTAALLAGIGARDPEQLADAEIWRVIDQWVEDAPRDIEPVLLCGSVMAHEIPVRQACERLRWSFEALVYPQLAAGERSVSAQQAYALVELADIARGEPRAAEWLADPASDLADVRTALGGTAFLAALERFLERYGHRGRYEYDWALPRYHEAPTPILQAVRAHLAAAPVAGGGTTPEQQADAAAAAWRAFEARVSVWQRWTTVRRMRQSIRKIKQYYLWREEVRSDLVRVISALRRWHLVLAARFVERGWIDRRDDYFLLHLSEVAALVRGEAAPASARQRVAERVAERARHAALAMPLLMRASELPSLLRTAGLSGGSDAGGELVGQAVSVGCVEGEVVVVRDPGDFGRMKRGAILVAPATDPSWTPLFTLAAGVIVEVGGVLSHASTIAREYGLPALANVRHATKRLKTGERVRLDAGQGLVLRLQD